MGLRPRLASGYDEGIMELRPDEKIVFQNRPAWRSFWVFILGFILVTFGPLVSARSPISPTVGLVFGVIFAVIIARRYSESYTLTNERLLAVGGLVGRTQNAINLEDVVDVEAHQGLSTRLVGAGHLLIRSRQPDQINILMYGQLDPEAVRQKIVRQVQAAGGQIERSA